MKTKSKLISLGAFVLTSLLACPVSADAFPTQGLDVHPLPGQVAITWDEVGGVERSVLISTEPLTEANRAGARVVAQGLEAGSANDWYEDPVIGHRPQGEARGWHIGVDLERGGGLFVHTLNSEDPVYFAVVAEGEAIEPGRNATTKPINPRPGSSEPIPQSASVIEEQAGTPEGLPVILYLHPHTSRPAGEMTHLFFGDATMGWRAGLPFKFKVSIGSDHILVEPFDRVWIGRVPGVGETPDAHARKFPHIETWWFGTNSRINSATGRAGGVAENYTERWVLHILDWVIDRYRADRNRVYASGTSMGSGALRLAFANPEKFAAVDVLVPFVDMSYTSGSEDNSRRLLAALGGTKTPLANGGTLADRVNLVEFVQQAKGDLPFTIARVGRNDTSVFWRRKPDFFRAMEKAKQGLLVTWDPGDHVTAGRKPLPGFPDFRDVVWLTRRFALNRSFPALTGCSLNEDFGDGSPETGTPSGFINRGIDWDVIADEDDRYELRLVGALPEMKIPFHADVTPRRLQKFTARPDEKFLAVNTGSDGAEVSRQEIAADKHGLLTVPAFAITSQGGNTLTIRRAK